MECSIVIPYRNRKPLLLATLRSLDQNECDRDRFEVVIVDDSSDDLSEKEVAGFGFALKYRRLEKREGAGAAFVRNRGIEHSAGDLIVFLDCDQITGKDFIANHIGFSRDYEKPNGLLAIGTRKMLLPNQRTADLRFAKTTEDSRKRIFDLVSGDVSRLLGAWSLVYSNNCSVRRELLAKYGGFDENFTGWGLEDEELGYRMMTSGVEIRYNPSIEVYHQFHTPAFGTDVRAQWEKNLSYFISKHDALPVRLKRMFSSIFDPLEYKRNPGLKPDDFMYRCYMRFELALRCIDDRNVEETRYSELMKLL